MTPYNTLLAGVNAAIASINYPATPAGLYEPIAYTMSLGGKRLRPVLLLMACEAAGAGAEQALDAAVGIELFHNFTLLHDDLMDRADVRRGQPTVHRRWGDNVAILSGDAMLTLAAQHIGRVADDVSQAVGRLFHATAMQVYEGQQHDMDFECRTDVAEDEYLEMIRLKTAVLLGAACKIGALIAHATPQRADALYAMGEQLGMAFQLRDDYLDVWGDPATFGKEIGGDIANNKKTYLLIHAMQRATGDDALELRRWLNDAEAPRQSKVAAVTALYERLGLQQMCEQAIARYTASATESLAAAALAPDSHAAFADLITRLTARQV